MFFQMLWWKQFKQLAVSSNLTHQFPLSHYLMTRKIVTGIPGLLAIITTYSRFYSIYSNVPFFMI